jgi:SAM-dependent methyltransferase
MSISAQPPAGLAPDWGIGHYELFAPALEPAAASIVALADPRAGEELLDVACGTGNAAVLAARTGANVTGLDLSPRLLDLARARAAAERVPAAFVVGDAQELPFEDGSFDAVVSVFGAIFAFDARRAFSEVLRVLKPEGRAFVSAWVPAGAIDAMIGVIVPAVGRAMGHEIPSFPWSDPDAVSTIASSLGATVRFHHGGDIVFTASSPERYLELQEREHPLMLLSRAVLEQAGTYPAVRRQALAALRDGNEDPHAFRATSPYRIIEIRHGDLND